MLNLPHRLPETGIGRNHARTINQLIEYARSLRPITTINEEVEHTTQGTVRRPKAGRGTGDGSIVPRWL